ncbi:MAG: hypothetical protein ACOX7K_05645 [Oscillospiraceae bacterium]|jgi:ribosomal protein L14E/L6E/L27E
MQDIFVYDIVESLAGHDKGRFYVVLKVENAYVYLVDGKIRMIQNPKRKKRKHVAKICTNESALTNMATDSEMKKVLAKARGKFDRGGK